MIISNLPIRIIVLAVTCLAWVSPALAEFRLSDGPSAIPASVSVYYGTASYNMSDLNHIIDLANAGNSFVDPIDHGTELGGRLTFHLRPRWSAGVSYTAIKASTGYGPFTGSDQYVEINANGSIIEVSLTHKDKISPRLHWGFTGALGIIHADGRIDVKDSETELHAEFVGSDLSFSANALVEYQLNRSAFIWLEGGVRKADTGPVKNNGRSWLTPEDKKMTFSYSGAFLRVGLRISSLFFE